MGLWTQHLARPVEGAKQLPAQRLTRSSRISRCAFKLRVSHAASFVLRTGLSLRGDRRYINRASLDG